MNLDQFIESRVDDGTFDSAGEFGVDNVSAVRSTLSSALPETHYYLFQVLQSLVQTKAQQIRIGVGMQENRISFLDTNKAYADLDALASRFSKSLSLASNHPHDLFFCGLLTSLGSHMTKVDFLYGDQCLTLSLDGVTRTTKDNPSEVCRIIFHRVPEQSASFAWSRVWGGAKKEFQIREAFDHSPIPIYVAGLPTYPQDRWRRGLDGDQHFGLLEAVIIEPETPNHRGEPQAGVYRASGSDIFYHTEPAESGPGGYKFRVAPNLLMMAIDDKGNPIESEVPSKNWDKRRWTVCFTSRTDWSSSILFIRNGCGIERVITEFPYPGIQVIAPADDLTVDASGYQLVRNREFDVRKAEAKILVEALADRLRKTDLPTLIAPTGQDPKKVLARFEWLNH